MRREEQNWRSKRQIRADFKVGVYVSKDSRDINCFCHSQAVECTWFEVLWQARKKTLVKQFLLLADLESFTNPRKFTEKADKYFCQLQAVGVGTQHPPSKRPQSNIPYTGLETEELLLWKLVCTALPGIIQMAHKTSNLVPEM